MSDEMFSKEEVQRMIREGVAEALKTERAKAEAEREEFFAQRAEFRQNYSDFMKKSKEPWINVENADDLEDMAKEGQIPMELDWNFAMVKMLRAHGVPGTTEEETIQHWLNTVYHDTGKADDDEPKDKGDYT